MQAKPSRASPMLMQQLVLSVPAVRRPQLIEKVSKGFQRFISMQLETPLFMSASAYIPTCSKWPHDDLGLERWSEFRTHII